MNDIVLEARPSWWNYIVDIVTTWFVGLILFIIALGVVLPEHDEYSYIFFLAILFIYISPVLKAILARKNTVLRVYDNKVVLEIGIFSKHIKEVTIKDIRMLDLQQKLWQRIFNIGNIAVATAGTSGYEMVITGIKDPKYVISKINEIKHTS